MKHACPGWTRHVSVDAKRYFAASAASSHDETCRLAGARATEAALLHAAAVHIACARDAAAAAAARESAEEAAVAARRSVEDAEEALCCVITNGLEVGTRTGRRRMSVSALFEHAPTMTRVAIVSG